MITVEEYRTRVLALAAPLEPIRLPLLQCVGLTTAEPVTARIPVPPFENSSMDGFAVRRRDVVVGVRLPVDGDIPAGATDVAPLTPGHARRIMTGAPVPAGADAIVPVEDTDIDPGPQGLPRTVELRVQPRWAAYIRRAGEDVKPGDVVLPAGTLLTPAALGAAASVGYGELLVHRRPRAVVVTTGDELVEPGAGLAFGQIPDSNGVVLALSLAEAGADVVTYRLSDDPEDFPRQLVAAADGADVVVTTGGISAGAYDVVKAASPDVTFEKVALQPGKPQGCGTIAAASGPVPMITLPGNPVSVFVSFQLFVRPFLAALAGRRYAPRTGRGTLGSALRSPAGRRQYVPVLVEGDRVIPARAGGVGSHMAASIAKAEALAVVPADATEVAAGTSLELIWL